MSYPFLFDGGTNNSYFFETELEVVYEIKFRSSDYLLGDQKAPYAHLIFEFIIEIVHNPLGKNPPLDKLVSTTISDIIKDFYFKQEQSVCIYICDSSDGKQELRRRKFDNWFYTHNQFGLVKIDEHIRDSKGIYYPISLIIQRNNPYFSEIIDGFSLLASLSNEDK